MTLHPSQSIVSRGTSCPYVLSPVMGDSSSWLRWYFPATSLQKLLFFHLQLINIWGKFLMLCKYTISFLLKLFLLKLLPTNISNYWWIFPATVIIIVSFTFFSFSLYIYSLEFSIRKCCPSILFLYIIFIHNCMNSRYFILRVRTPYYHLFFSLNCSSFGHWEGLQVGFCVLLTWFPPFLSTSLLSGTTICSYSILYFPSSNPWFNHFPKNLWFLLLENSI